MAEIFSDKDEFRRNRRKSKFEKRSYSFYYNKFKRIYCSVYDWVLPENMDPAVLENYLFEDGRALIWRHELLGWIVTRCDASAWDVNRRPIRFRPKFDVVTDEVGKVYELPDELALDQCVPVFDTSIRDVKRSDSMFLIEEIVDISETIRMQCFNQKTPLMAISGSQQQRAKNLIDIKNLTNGCQIMTVDEDISNTLKVLDFNAPFNVEKLNALRNVRINEVLESGGIDGADPFMKQDSARLLVSQVESNDEILNYILVDGLRSREKAAERIAELTGGMCSVSIQGFVRPLMAEQQASNESEEDLTEVKDDGTAPDADRPVQ